MTAAVPGAARVLGRVVAVSVGRVVAVERDGRRSSTAFRKAPLPGRALLGRLGFPGDEHAYAGHGGVDGAVCVYSHDHYPHWRAILGDELPEVAAFGENLTVDGLRETEVELGDVLAVGEALVQVTEPRAPCHKIAARYGRPRMAVWVQEAGYTGFLMRVLREGEVGAGDEVLLVERAGHGVTVAEANRVLNVDRRDLDGARRLLASGALGERLAAKLRDRIGIGGEGEDVDRLFGSDDQEIDPGAAAPAPGSAG